MFGDILNMDLGKKPDKKELQEIKQAVLGNTSQETANFSQGVLRTINNYIETEKAFFLKNTKESHEAEIEKARLDQHEIDEKIRFNETELLRKKHYNVVEKIIDEINKTSSEDAHKILPVLGEIKREFEKI